MPRIRKLGAAEVAALEQPTFGPRAQMARAYDTALVDFAAGDYGRVALGVGERRAVVRSRLHAAAKRRGLRLRFRPGPAPALLFQVTPMPPAVAQPAPPVAAPLGEAPRSEQRITARRPPPRQAPSASERYRDVLPRWMRTQPAEGQRARDKRRRS